MTTYELYSQLFSDDNFTPHDNFPLNPIKYKVDRELSAINLVGINYNPDIDAYIVSVPHPKYDKQYFRQEPEPDIVKCIILYDELIVKYNIDLPTYVIGDTRQYTTRSSKYFDKNAREFIQRYHETISQADLGKLLQIPVKEVNKYITNTYPDDYKPSNDTVVVVWDVRDRYEQTLNNIKKATVSDADIDLLLGL